MARRTRVKKRRKQSFSSKMNNLAYNMGLVEKGLKNPNSQVSASYNKGLNSSTLKKKPVI